VRPTISSLRAREILDSGGRPTVEVDLELDDRSFARASVPAGTSTGRHEARDLRDHDPDRFEGQGVLGAVQSVRDTIGPALHGRSPLDQEEIDAFAGGGHGSLMRLDPPRRARLAVMPTQTSNAVKSC